MSATPRPQPHLSIVFPAYNEAARIADAIDAVDAFTREQRLDAEIIVVDDGSRDRTGEIAGAKLKPLGGQLLGDGVNRGKGYAVRRGIESARGRWVLITDVDLAAPIAEFPKLAEALRDRDADLAIGSRRVPGADVGFEQTAVRRLASGIFNGAVRLMTGLRLHDTQCGFKLLDRRRVQPIVERMRVDGFAFDVELLFLSQRLGLQIAEVPVSWKGSDTSSVRLLTDPARMLLDIARIRWAFRRGAYRGADA